MMKYIIKIRPIINFIFFTALISCQAQTDNVDKDTCELNANIFVNEGTLICKTIGEKVYAGGLTHLIGKDKSVFKFYVLSKEKGEFKIDKTYTYEAQSYGYSNNVKYAIRDGCLVVEFTKLDDDILMYLIPLKESSLTKLSNKLRFFEDSLQPFIAEYNLD